MSIQVRTATYRGRSGFTISGHHVPTGHKVSIFTETRASADHIAAKVRRGEQIESIDFEATP